MQLNLDDENIPDFTAVRCHDNFRDIIEIKQPVLTCFKKKDNFSSSFNDAWNQSERYLSFVHRQRNYLKEEKGLSFENPKCILIIGSDLTPNQLKMIREKEILAKSVIVYTYDHIQRTACHILNLISSTRETSGYPKKEKSRKKGHLLLTPMLFTQNASIGKMGK